MKLMHLTAQTICESLVSILKLKFGVSMRRRSPQAETLPRSAGVYRLERRRLLQRLLCVTSSSYQESSICVGLLLCLTGSHR